MYNVGAIYEIIGRVLNGTSVIAYTIKDRRNGNIFNMQKQMVEQLALNKQLYNCTGQIYSEIVVMKGINCKLSKLPKYDLECNKIIEDESTKKKTKADLKIVGKVQNGRMVSAYVVASVIEPSKKVTLPRDKVVELARNGRFINAKSQMNGETIVLRGDNGFNLSQLPVYNAGV